MENLYRKVECLEPTTCKFANNYYSLFLVSTGQLWVTLSGCIHPKSPNVSRFIFKEFHKKAAEEVF